MKTIHYRLGLPVLWGLGVFLMGPSGCSCDEPQVTERTCDFVVETPDPADMVVFRDTEVGAERERSIRIVNRGNTVLETFGFAFSERNGEHYRLGEEAETLRVEPGVSGTVRVLFAPLAESTNLGSVLTVSHNPVSGAGCPAFAITLEGAGFERIQVVDAGPDAGTPDGGWDAGAPPDAGTTVDAGVIVPPDGGVEVGPGARFSARGALQHARSEFGAVALGDGSVVVVGGYGENGQALASIERFYVERGQSRIVGYTRVPRGEPAITRLADGRVAIVGGLTSSVGGVAVSTVEVYDPADDSVTCPPEQGDCSLQDIVQGRGALPEGRVHPWISTPAPGDLRFVVGGGRVLDETGAQAPAPGGYLVTLGGLIEVEPLSGAEVVSPRVDPLVVHGPTGELLLIGGRDAAGAPLTDVFLYRPDTTSIAPLSVSGALLPRSFGAAARLEAGDVLLAGGIDGVGSAVSTLERLVDPFGLRPGEDPAVEAVSGVSLPGPRVRPTLHALAGDVLLLAGGLDRDVQELEAADSVLPLDSAAVLVPFGSGYLRVAPTNRLAVPRYAGEAVRVMLPPSDALPAGDERVVFLGGSATAPRRTPHPQAEFFGFSSQSFEVYGLMGPGTALVPNAPASLFALGGIDPHTGAISERVRAFDTIEDRFVEHPPLDAPRRDHTVVRLADENTVLVVGGRDAAGQVLGTASLYNPFSGFDEPLSATLNRPRAFATGTRLEDGTVLLCGGQGAGGEALDTCELFLPPDEVGNPASYDSARFVLVAGRMSTGRVGHTATRLEDSGEVLLVGGGDIETDLVRADLYAPEAQALTATGLPERARRGHSAIYLGGGRVLIAGGEVYIGGVAADDSAEVYERAGGVFRAVPEPMRQARVGAGALLLENGEVLIAGGVREDAEPFPSRALRHAEVYAPGPTGIGSFSVYPELSLTFGRGDVSAPEVFGRGVWAHGTHRDGRLAHGDAHRSPLYFVEKLINAGEEPDPPEPPGLDAGPENEGS